MNAQACLITLVKTIAPDFTIDVRTENKNNPLLTTRNIDLANRDPHQNL